MHTLFPSS